MTLPQNYHKIEELQQWLIDNPNHPNRTIIEADLRKLEAEHREKYQRLEDLYQVLGYCSEEQKFGRNYIFSVFERMCVNQERGSLLSQLNSDNFSHEIRIYTIPPSIETKVKTTLEKIKVTSWSNFYQNCFTEGQY